MGEKTLAKVSHRGLLFEAECVVLNDGRRGFSLKGANVALGGGSKASNFLRLLGKLSEENRAIEGAPDERVERRSNGVFERVVGCLNAERIASEVAPEVPAA